MKRRWMSLLFLALFFLPSPGHTSLSAEEKNELYRRAVTALQTGRHRDAATWLYAIVERDPRELAAYEMLVNLLIQHQTYGTAAMLVSRASQQGVRSPKLWLQQSQALFFLGGLDAAIHPLIKMEQLLAEKGD